jgi:hypothetical protein
VAADHDHDVSVGDSDLAELRLEAGVEAADFDRVIGLFYRSCPFRAENGGPVAR